MNNSLLCKSEERQKDGIEKYLGLVSNNNGITISGIGCNVRHFYI